MTKFWIPLLFLVLVGCTSGPEKKKIPDVTPYLKVQYHVNSDTITVLARKQPFYNVAKKFSEATAIDLYYDKKQTSKEVDLEIRKAPLGKALKMMVKKGGYVVRRARVGVGFLITSKWNAPTSPNFLKRGIEVITDPEAFKKFLYISNRKSYVPLGGAAQEKEKMADLFHAYRPVMQRKLIESIPYLKEKSYRLPRRIESPDRIRAYFSLNRREILCDYLTLASQTHKVHVVFKFDLHTLQLRKISMFVTALPGAKTKSNQKG